jgi:NADH-quinone oxidoreductase subunit F
LPAAIGYDGRPTLVQNVETLSRVPAAVRDPERYRERETTLVSIWGDVPRPGVYDVTLGAALDETVRRHAGATAIAAVFPAGPSAPPLGAGKLGTPIDPDALRSEGSGLGTGAMLVVGPDVCPLSLAVSLSRFFERESCGQCPPCVVGSTNLARLAASFHGGTARARDLSFLTETAGFMKMHGYCAHSRTAAHVVEGVLANWSAHVADHAAGPCGLRAMDPFAPGSPEQAALAAAVERAAVGAA